MPNCVPTCEMDSAQVVHYLFISYWVNIIVRIAKKNKFTTNVPFFTTFLIVLFHGLNKLTHLVVHAYLLTGASKGRPIFLYSDVQVIQWGTSLVYRA